MSMDRPIEKARWSPRRIAGVAFAALVAIMLGLVVADAFGPQRVSVDPEHVTLSQVRQAEFEEYVPINGSVQPTTTVFLDLEEGGIVDKIYVEGGQPIAKGELILSFSNTAAQKQNIETETRLLENLDQLRNSKISLTQSGLILKDQLLDLDYKIRDLEKTFKRYDALMKDSASQLSREQFESTEYQLNYLRNKRELLRERIRRETELQQQQSEQIDLSIERISRNLELLARIVDSLEVRAPIDGHLSMLNAEVGQSFQRGERIGQIDQLDGFKVRGEIDQFYVTKIAVGQRGTFEFGGRAHTLEIFKIYPEVSEDLFQVDMRFVAAVPEGIKRGQTLRIELSLSERSRTKVVSKGAFYRHTRGRWVYVLSSDGQHARRSEVVMGRQNPQLVEVLEGLQLGDWIVTSNYDDFRDVAELAFSKPVVQRMHEEAQ
jgi:HlyD family secretion protein